MKNKMIDRNLYKKAKEFDTEVIDFIKQKREEEEILFKKNRKEINDFENTKRNEKYNFCIENGGHFFKGYIGHSYREHIDYGAFEGIVYYRDCDLCGFREEKYDLDESDIVDYLEWE